jgi:hypothetical protein
MSGKFSEIIQSSVYGGGFSGKLSSVTTHSEAQVRIEPIPTPEQGAQPPEQGAQPPEQGAQPAAESAALPQPREVGGREGPEPTRFGDWELRGRCIDF